MLSKDRIKTIISDIESASKRNDTDLFSKTRDVFQARVDTFVSRTNRYLESAVIGEIGNNTFDHNLDYDSNHQRGAYFSYNEKIVSNLVRNFVSEKSHKSIMLR